jgi:hypothetical protein
LFFRWTNSAPRLCAAACLLLALLLANSGCQHEAPVAASSRPEGSAVQVAGAEASPAAKAPPTRTRKTKDAEAIDGRWLLRSAHREFTVDLMASDQGLRGHVYGPSGAKMPIKIGVYSGDAFLFETTGGDAGWLWSGHLSSERLTGQRENVQTGAVESFARNAWTRLARPASAFSGSFGGSRVLPATFFGLAANKSGSIPRRCAIRRP